METNENENTIIQKVWDAGKAVLREVYNNTDLPQEGRKISNNNLILHLKKLEKEQTKPKTNIKKKKSEQK